MFPWVGGENWLDHVSFMSGLFLFEGEEVWVFGFPLLLYVHFREVSGRLLWVFGYVMRLSRSLLCWGFVCGYVNAVMWVLYKFCDGLFRMSVAGFISLSNHVQRFIILPLLSFAASASGCGFSTS